MKLDPRIKALSDILTCFDIERAEQFIGQKGYFADDLSDYDSLENGEYGTLTEVLDNEVPFKVDNRCHWKYFILECSLKPKEKQYRPYTINEFIEKFHFGDSIILRPKNHKSLQFNVVHNGYAVDAGSNEIKLYLGCGVYTLPELFQSYERFYCGRWYPFGVEVKE